MVLLPEHPTDSRDPDNQEQHIEDRQLGHHGFLSSSPSSMNPNV
jgi:hypothetical protein